MIKIFPMLTFNGDCSDALAFYINVFDGKQTKIQTYGDNKEHLAKLHQHVSAKWADKIMHASFVTPEGEKLYLCDKKEAAEFHQGNADSIGIDFEKPEDLEKVYHALSEGGVIAVPIHKAFWHATYAVVIDKFKKRWELNCQIVSID